MVTTALICLVIVLLGAVVYAAAVLQDAEEKAATAERETQTAEGHVAAWKAEAESQKRVAEQAATALAVAEANAAAALRRALEAEGDAAAAREKVEAWKVATNDAWRQRDQLLVERDAARADAESNRQAVAKALAKADAAVGELKDLRDVANTIAGRLTEAANWNA